MGKGGLGIGDEVREFSNGGCVKMQTRREGDKQSENLADVIYGMPPRRRRITRPWGIPLPPSRPFHSFLLPSMNWKVFLGKMRVGWLGASFPFRASSAVAAMRICMHTIPHPQRQTVQEGRKQRLFSESLLRKRQRKPRRRPLLLLCWVISLELCVQDACENPVTLEKFLSGFLGLSCSVQTSSFSVRI